MIASQRKSHKYIWLAITIVLPVVLFFAIKDLDFSSKSDKLKPAQLTASIKDNTVQIQLNSPFQSPSPLVYQLDANKKPTRVLGQLEGVGQYKFPISSTIKGLVIIDAIKKEELFKVEF